MDEGAFIEPDIFPSDYDSLFAMPLDMVPIQTPALRRGRFIRNAALLPAIEIYRDSGVGSGMILLNDFTSEFGQQQFGWENARSHPDLKLINQLGKLTSFDVYSLRILLRDLGIPVEDEARLQLSADAKASLISYLSTFTRPLVARLYGGESAVPDDVTDLLSLFRRPDNDGVMKNLIALSRMLSIRLDEIPKFLEEYGDVYLSVCYYQRYIDDLYPKISTIVDEFEALGKHRMFEQDRGIQTACERLSVGFWNLISSASGRTERFQRDSANMWENISATKFHDMARFIRSCQTSVAGVLCGLGLKVRHWRQRFRTPDSGGPMARAEMVASFMRPGLELLEKLDKTGP